MCCRAHGIDCDVMPARAVRQLDAYRAVILGTALYMFHFHKDAKQFLVRNQVVLCNGLPIAIFAGGPTGEGKAEEWGEVRKHVDADLAKMPWLQPASLFIIGGRHDPDRLRFPWNLVPALKQMPPSDLRDWQAIRSWAGDMAEKIAAGTLGKSS